MLNFEKARKPMALITIAALGGLSVGAAEAKPPVKRKAESVRVEKSKGQVMRVAPEGVRALINPQEIQAEAMKAIVGVHKRWNGVLIVHAPKKLSSVSFNQSPTAYTNPLGVSLEPETEGVMIAVQPGIEEFKTPNGEVREYAVTFDPASSKWAFLDIGWAKENGALTSYAFADSKPRAVPYEPMRETNAMPYFQSPDHMPTKEDMLRVKDVNGKIRDLVPSSVIPHI